MSPTLARFVDAWGQPIAISPHYVASVEPTEQGFTIITLSSGQEKRVLAPSLDEVLYALYDPETTRDWQLPRKDRP